MLLQNRDSWLTPPSPLVYCHLKFDTDRTPNCTAKTQVKYPPKTGRWLEHRLSKITEIRQDVPTAFFMCSNNTV